MAHKHKELLEKIMLLASKLFRAPLFPNNVGLYFTRAGTPIVCGLLEGSSDGIGYLPVVITPEMVGKKVAIFLGVEVKTGRDKLKPKQILFMDTVNANGGIALCARTEEEFTEQTLLRIAALQSQAPCQAE